MKEQDKLGDLIKEVGHETTSADFIENVMQRVEASQATSFVVKPLISTKAWLSVAAVLLLVLFATLLWPESNASESSYVSEARDLIPRFSLPVGLPKISSALTYGLMSLLLVLGIQFGVLKRFFDNYYSNA